MARLFDRFECRARDHGAEAAPIFFAQHAIRLAPEKQSRDPDAVQPMPEPRIVHVGRPAEARARLAIARRRERTLLRQARVVALRFCRIGPCERVELGLRDRPDIDDVAGLAVADLHADGIGEDQMGQPVGVLRRDFAGDPAADPDADDQHVAQVHRLQQVEIEIRKLVDACDALGQRRVPETGMGGRDQPSAARQQVKDRRVAFDADSGMKEKDRTAVAAHDRFKLRAVDDERGVGVGRG